MSVTRLTMPASLLAASLLLAGCAGAPASDPGGSTAATQPPSTAGAPTPAASSEDTPAPSTGGGVALAACDLLADEEIETVLGVAALRKEPGIAMGVHANGCEWFFAPPGETSPFQLVVGVTDVGGRQLFDQSFAAFVEEMEYQVVDGLGDAALRLDKGSFMAVQGDILADVFLIDDSFGASTERDEQAKALLERVIARIAAGG